MSNTPTATPLGAAQSDLDAVEKIVRDAGTSFYRGMRILPPGRRMAMYAIYAFCRLVDDIADDPAPFDTILPRLNRWRDRIAALYRGEAEGDVERVLLRAIDIEVAGVAGHDLARQHDLDRATDRVRDDRHLLGRDAVQPSDRLRPQGRGLSNALVVGVGCKHHVQRQPAGARVLAADHLGDLGQFHARQSLGKRLRRNASTSAAQRSGTMSQILCGRPG